MIIGTINYSEIFVWLTGVSVVAFVLSLIIFPLIIARLPADYFIRPSKRPSHRSLQYYSFKLLKNLLGLIFVIIGVIMLFIPGQGILTLILGISLTDFPGKAQLQERIIRMPRVARSLNWLRHRAKRPPFTLPESTPGGKRA